MRAVKEVLLDEIESLSDEEAAKLLEFLHTLRNRMDSERILKDLALNPAFSVPRNFPPRFKKVEPAVGKGIPASQLLIQDRQ